MTNSRPSWQKSSVVERLGNVTFDDVEIEYFRRQDRGIHRHGGFCCSAWAAAPAKNRSDPPANLMVMTVLIVGLRRRSETAGARLEAGQPAAPTWSSRRPNFGRSGRRTLPVDRSLSQRVAGLGKK